MRPVSRKYFRKPFSSENVPLAEAIQQLRAEGYAGLPNLAEITGRWTPEQERALAELISMDQVRRVWIGSLEITELIRRKLAQEISSAAAAQFSLSVEQRVGAMGSVSSPFGGVQFRKGFWFNINAELIVYGATEPDAKVTIGGREIKLRPDGSFSFRFALPDGKYELPVVAVSADQTDGRAAELEFSRETEYRGEVGAHPPHRLDHARIVVPFRRELAKRLERLLVLFHPGHQNGGVVSRDAGQVRRVTDPENARL